MAVLLGAISAVAFAAAEETYEIRFSRPVKPGSTWKVRVVATGKRVMTMKAGEETIGEQAEEFSVEFESQVTVMEVDANGESVKETHTVSKCVKTEDGEDKVLLQPGTVLLAGVEDSEEVFEINGQRVSDEIADVLDLIISLSTNETTDDDVFGSEKRRKVGESWEVNREAMAADLNEDDMAVKPENISGTATLVEVVEYEGKQCLKLQSDLFVEGFSVEMLTGLEITQSRMEGFFGGYFPTDNVSMPSGTNMWMKMRITAKGRPNPDGPEVTVEMRGELAREVRTYTVIEKTAG